jgi:hypothetical protein
MFTVGYKAEALKDISETAEWYNLQQEGLRQKFFDDLDELISYLEMNPYLSRKHRGNIHQAPMKRFPYVVLFRVESKQVVIFSVFNCYQNPKKKRRK